MRVWRGIYELRRRLEDARKSTIISASAEYGRNARDARQSTWRTFFSFIYIFFATQGRWSATAHRKTKERTQPQDTSAKSKQKLRRKQASQCGGSPFRGTNYSPSRVDRRSNEEKAPKGRPVAESFPSLNNRAASSTQTSRRASANKK